MNNTLDASEVYDVHLDEEGNEWVLTNKGIKILLVSCDFNYKSPL